jgi:hypothetical protein
MESSLSLATPNPSLTTGKQKLALADLLYSETPVSR